MVADYGQNQKVFGGAGGVQSRMHTATVPECTPPQFKDPNVFPYGPKYFNKEEAAEDARAPFFTEAYLYTLLGKEDARTLLYLFDEVCKAAGFDADESEKS